MARKKLGEILIQAGVLDQSRLRAALVEQRRWGGHLGRILVDMKLISEEVLVQALSQQLNIPATNMENRDIPPEVLDLIPGDLAEQYSLVPFNREGKFLDVAMTDPTNMGFIDELRIRTQLNVRPYLAGPKMIERALARHYGRGGASLGIGVEPGGGIDPTVADGGNPQTSSVDILDLAPKPAPAPAGLGAAGATMNQITPPQGGPPLGPSTATIAAAGAPPAGPAPGPAPGPVPGPAIGPARKHPGAPLARPATQRTDDPMTSAQRRAQAMALATGEPNISPEIVNLQERLAKLEALVSRDEEVIRKLLGLLVEKGIASRDEILQRIK